MHSPQKMRLLVSRSCAVLPLFLQFSFNAALWHDYDFFLIKWRDLLVWRNFRDTRSSWCLKWRPWRSSLCIRRRNIKPPSTGWRLKYWWKRRGWISWFINSVKCSIMDFWLYPVLFWKTWCHISNWNPVTKLIQKCLYCDVQRENTLRFHVCRLEKETESRAASMQTEVERLVNLRVPEAVRSVRKETMEVKAQFSQLSEHALVLTGENSALRERGSQLSVDVGNLEQMLKDVSRQSCIHKKVIVSVQLLYQNLASLSGTYHPAILKPILLLLWNKAYIYDCVSCIRCLFLFLPPLIFSPSDHRAAQG